MQIEVTRPNDATVKGDAPLQPAPGMGTHDPLPDRELFSSRAMLDAIGDGISILDTNLKILYQNPKQREIFGNHIGETCRLACENSQGNCENGCSVLGTLRTGVTSRVVKSVCAREGMRFVEISASAIRNDQGGITAVFVCTRDLTREKRAAEKSLLLEDKMLHVQRMGSLGLLASEIAHDFNNMLTVILGSTGLALAQLSEDAALRDHLAMIESAALAASDLANQMLAYSGKGGFSLQLLDLNALIDGLFRILKGSVSKRSRIELQLMPGLPQIEADAIQMRQILMNLVINGSEAIGGQNGVITISTGVCDGQGSGEPGAAPEEGRHVYLEVSDTGCGMDQATMAQIFDPFFSTKFTGRGLGMAAVMGILRSHKGSIKIQSEPNRGSCFRVCFPVKGGAPAVITRGTGVYEDPYCR